MNEDKKIPGPPFYGVPDPGGGLTGNGRVMDDVYQDRAKAKKAYEEQEAKARYEERLAQHARMDEIRRASRDDLWAEAMAVKPEPIEHEGKTVYPTAHGGIRVMGSRVEAFIEWRFDTSTLKACDFDVRMHENTGLPVLFRQPNEKG